MDNDTFVILFFTVHIILPVTVAFGLYLWYKRKWK